MPMRRGEASWPALTCLRYSEAALHALENACNGMVVCERVGGNNALTAVHEAG